MNITRWPARMSLNEKLKRLQISEDDFELYCFIFIKDWSRYCRKEIGGEWFMVRNRREKPVRLIRHVVGYHLLKKFWISTFPGKIARYLCFDIDESPEQLAIYRILKEWVKNPLVFRSSSSGGLHIYIHFAPEFLISVQKLQSIAKATCKRLGINVAPGVCEIFPNRIRSLRLPLGRESFLLDPESLNPICTDVGTAIRHIKNNIRYYSFEDLFPQLAKRMAQRKTFQEAGGRLNEHAVEQYGIRYNSGSNMILDSSSFGETKAPNILYREECHHSDNHQPKIRQPNFQNHLKPAGSAINPLNINAKAKEQILSEDVQKQLRVGDVLKIIALTPDFRLQKFILSLLLFALKAKDSKNAFRLPWVVITRFDCCSRETYQEKMHFCQDKGLITKVREFYRQEHRARTFKVDYVFSEEGDFVISLEDGLKRLLPLKELKSRYSRRVYDNCFRS